MPHPDAFQLQSYFDGELSDEVRERTRLHIKQCLSCQRELQASQRLSRALHETMPTEQLFMPEGRFWSRLAGKLSVDRPPTWPLVPYLPPLVLTMLGALAHVLISVTLVTYGLTGLGLLPSPGPMVSERLSSLLSDQALPQWLRTRADRPIQAAQTTANHWGNLSQTTQNRAIFVAVLLALEVLLCVVVAFYSSWAMCWSKSARPNRQNGVSNHGLRSHR